MSPELDKQLVEKYPLLYRDRYGSPKNTLMCFGFACGDGWYDLLDRASAKIEAEIICLRDEEKVPEEDLPRAAQIKEKWSGLRMYIDMEESNTVIEEAILEAEEEASKTCEECGSPGTCRNSSSWIVTLCDSCELSRWIKRAKEAQKNNFKYLKEIRELKKVIKEMADGKTDET